MKQYLLSILSAAMISGLVTKLMGEKGTQGALGKLIAGLFLAFTVISPLKEFRLKDLTEITDSYTQTAQAIAEEGKTMTTQAVAQRIKQECEAYILDKARQLDTELAVTITLNEEVIPTPVGVALSGNISPNSKRTLEAMIAQDLGIPREAQTWT